MTSYVLHPSPIGDLLVLADDQGRITGLYVAGESGAPEIDPAWRPDPAATRKATDQLDAYFDGDRSDFELDVAVDGTPFQLEVWSALRDIPYGTTISYRELAEAVGRPGASRAVGQANGRNPVSIIVPCHRVIASNGSLGGYGWGLERKRQLLDLETGVSSLV